MPKIISFFVLCWTLFAAINLNAQNDKEMSHLPYREIPAYPESYSPGNVAARVIDGLGYRYYWATENLTEEDLAYVPAGDESRSSLATLEHIYNLSQTIVNATRQSPNIRPAAQEELSFAEMRRKTLENLQAASNLLKASEEENLSDFSIVFQRGEDKVEFPFWNLLNGPIADAIYHVGQVVSYRRSSGNPINPMVNVLTGKTRE